MKTKKNHKILKVIIIVFTVFFILFIVLGLKQNLDENNTKKLLANEITNLISPPNCKETSRKYQRGDVDAVSTWFVTYNCNSITGGEAYNFITANLVRRGYHSLQDFSTVSTGAVQIFYAFTYSSNQFTAEYTFNNTDSTYPSSQKNLLIQEPVNNIYLELSRNKN